MSFTNQYNNQPFSNAGHSQQGTSSSNATQPPPNVQVNFINNSYPSTTSTPAPQSHPRNVASPNGAPYPTPESMASTPTLSGAPSPLMLPGPQGQQVQQFPQVAWSVAVGPNGVPIQFIPQHQAALSSSTPQLPTFGMPPLGPSQYPFQLVQGYQASPVAHTHSQNGQVIQYQGVLVPAHHQGLPVLPQAHPLQIQHYAPQVAQTMQQTQPVVPTQPAATAASKGKRALVDREESAPKRARMNATAPVAHGSSSAAAGPPAASVAGLLAPKKRGRPRNIRATTSMPVASGSSSTGVPAQPAVPNAFGNTQSSSSELWANLKSDYENFRAYLAAGLLPRQGPAHWPYNQQHRCPLPASKVARTPNQIMGLPLWDDPTPALPVTRNAEGDRESANIQPYLNLLARHLTHEDWRIVSDSLDEELQKRAGGL